MLKSCLNFVKVVVCQVLLAYVDTEIKIDALKYVLDVDAKKFAKSTV